MKINHRILLGCFCIFLVFFLLLTGIFRNSHQVDENIQIARIAEKRLFILMELQDLIQSEIFEVTLSILTKDLDLQSSHLKNIRNKIKEKFQDLESSLNDGITMDIQYLNIEYNTMGKMLDEVKRLANSDKLMESKKALFSLKKEIYDTFIGFHFKKLIHLQNIDIKQSAFSFQKILSNVKWNTILGFIAAIIIALITSVWLSQTIGIRLILLKKATEDISGGKFHIRLPTQGNDEIASLAIAFEKMAKSLEETKQEIRTQHELLVRSTQLNSLGEMAAGIAHEINTPLAVIQLRAEIIEDATNDQKHDLELIRNSSRTILETTLKITLIIKSVLDASRNKEKPYTEIATLQKLISDAIPFFVERAKNLGIQFSVSLPKNLITLYCKPIEISQVIINLLNNAFDAAQTHLSPWVKLETSVDHNVVEISVTDCGPGISEEIKLKLMEPFFTTKGPGRGTGLGLSISKRIMIAHQGSLVLDGTSANTRFVITFPIKPLLEISEQAPKAA